MNTDVNTLLSMLQIEEIYYVLNDIENIPYALIKGEALSIQAYNSAGLTLIIPSQQYFPYNFIQESIILFLLLQ